jgi:hypothetical protein
MPFQSPITTFIYCSKMKIAKKKIKYFTQFLSLTLFSFPVFRPVLKSNFLDLKDLPSRRVEIIRIFYLKKEYNEKDQ